MERELNVEVAVVVPDLGALRTTSRFSGADEPKL